MSAGVPEAVHDPGIPTKPAGRAPAPAPFQSPSYPPRTHFPERGALEDRLRRYEERLQAAEQRLGALGSDPRRADLLRTYHQMLGARDQVAEAVRRLPLETGALYDEDKERLEQAVAAFERAWRRWESAGN